jgi:hypothetical protein
VPLEGVKPPTILTLVRAIPTVRVRPGSKLASCLRGSLAPPSAGVAVERIGVSGESITFADATHTGLYACDSGGGARQDDRHWCGRSFGRLYSGQLRDPRLDVLCATERGTPLGFAWVEPSKAARYVVVQHVSYSEAYEVAAGLPVRISTETGLRSDPVRVTVEVAEHDAAGKLIGRYRLAAVPAG